MARQETVSLRLPAVTVQRFFSSGQGSHLFRITCWRGHSSPGLLPVPLRPAILSPFHDIRLFNPGLHFPRPEGVRVPSPGEGGVLCGAPGHSQEFLQRHGNERGYHLSGWHNAGCPGRPGIDLAEGLRRGEQHDDGSSRFPPPRRTNPAKPESFPQQTSSRCTPREFVTPYMHQSSSPCSGWSSSFPSYRISCSPHRRYHPGR